jgi:hypothetical protein
MEVGWQHQQFHDIPGADTSNGKIKPSKLSFYGVSSCASLKNVIQILIKKLLFVINKV